MLLKEINDIVNRHLKNGDPKMISLEIAILLTHKFTELNIIVQDPNKRPSSKVNKVKRFLHVEDIWIDSPQTIQKKEGEHLNVKIRKTFF